MVLGSDYDLALQEIAYYRVCHEKSQLIQDYVTFHLYAEIKYANQLDINSWPEVDCEKWTSAADSVTFKQGEYRNFFLLFWLTPNYFSKILRPRYTFIDMKHPFILD